MRSQNLQLSYLVTLPYDDGKELSVFVDSAPGFIFGGSEGRLHERPHFEVVVHAAAARGSGGGVDSPLSEHPLLIGGLVPDVGPIDEDGAQQPFSGDKMGGAPYLVHGNVALKHDVGQLLGEGYMHALQLDFPADPGARVKGPWPFGTGMFHLLLLSRGEGPIEWRCFWEA